MDDQRARIDDDTFEDWVFAAVDDLPPAFRERLGSVAIVIEDRPTRAQQELTGVERMYGQYHGIPRSVLSADQVQAPSRLTIFRGILEEDYPAPDALRAMVVETVRHEIAHHFGISDERLRELERERGGH
jgi:predicted Zn-dependent protease with MMP-like domain